MLFAAVIFSILWLLQTVFLQSFYNKMLIGNTKKAAQMIAENSSNEDIMNIIDSTSFDNSILICVTNEAGDVLYYSDEYNGAHKRSRIINEPNNEERSDIGIIKEKRFDGGRILPVDFDEFMTKLKSSDGQWVEYSTNTVYIYGTYIDYYSEDEKAILYVSTTLDPVGSAVTIIRMQLAWVIGLSLVIGFIISWFLAKSFGKPVIQLSEKANKLGEPDYPRSFSKGFCAELDDLCMKLDKTSDKLAEAQLFQTELLANVSHDLRTPLTMIKGYSEMIADTSWDNEKQCREDIAVIVRETDRLTSLVNEILEYSELKVGNTSECFERFDLSALVKKVCAVFEDLYKGKDETVETQIEDHVFIHGSSGRLHRAVYNLIDNAFRYTDSSRKVTVMLSTNNNSAVIEVIDYGSGIPESELEHIWDRYYTFRQRQGRGVSGLGLAIVKQTVDMHGGTCSVESVPGKGSKFRIELLIDNKEDSDS